MGVSRNGGGDIIASGGSGSEIRTITPPTANPADVVKISPENLKIANTYLACQSIAETSKNLSLPTDEITEVLNRREIKAYIDNVFLDVGFNNRFRMRAVMDAVINKKLEEMDATDLGSGKDIIEIMALSHKMAMDQLDRQIKLEEAKAKNAHIRNQVNVQVNNADGSGSKYESLIQRLMTGKVD